MSLRMSPEERETFLAELHVGVLSISREGAPLCVPIWYDYEPGGNLQVITGENSPKHRELPVGAVVSLCAQSEEVPYRYVTVTARVVAVEPAQLERDLRPMAHRYLGEEFGDAYVAETGADGQVKVILQPEGWRSEDYAKR